MKKRTRKEENSDPAFHLFARRLQGLHAGMCWLTENDAGKLLIQEAAEGIIFDSDDDATVFVEAFADGIQMACVETSLRNLVPDLQLAPRAEIPDMNLFGRAKQLPGENL